MAKQAEVPLKAVWKALEECLPGYRKVQKLHNWWVWSPAGGPPFMLPLGKHGRRTNVDIESGHVRSLARHFQIEECMREKLPGVV